MSEETQCPNCGRPVADGSLSCSSCGHDIGGRQEGSDPPEPAAPDLDAHERRALGGEGRRPSRDDHLEQSKLSANGRQPGGPARWLAGRAPLLLWTDGS